ncbi:hypothetical protein BD324DRAFT_618100 [Kockovaella imperatae]|uniref:Cullin family profile domain-containing protein n=1 Tax=Kockovaella imperatae TaxID=4999 RepID=A0A1Y1ULQ0_9TREE|nr:hypothetical protein BD324DRAFT_618100 [Kockovaella imperatae]ORX38980.1 hypothetical protein BD324DRAFT_618100 [Kockovaella imperatae]
MALVAALQLWDAPSTSEYYRRRYEDLAKADSLVKSYLEPRNVSAGVTKPVETPAISSAFKMVIEAGLAPDIYSDFIIRVDSSFDLIRREIDEHMDEATLGSSGQADTILVNLFERLALWQRIWAVPLKAFNDPKLIPQFTKTFHQLLHASFPKCFPDVLQHFLESSLLRVPEPISPRPAALPKVAPPSPHLSRLGIIPRYSATLSKVAYVEIERIVKDEAGKGWETRRLNKARLRVSSSVAGWLTGMFDGTEAAQTALRPMFSRFDYYLCKCFFDTRTDELFDIIVDYPDSMAALEDLKECLFKVDQRAALVDKLKAANIKRLLHPGAETKDVIAQYISTIRALRILDPPGVLLHKVADPIRRHLRERPDTIKCIVATLVEGEELQDENELGAGDGAIDQGNMDGVENFLDNRWEPEPVDAAPEFRSGKASDIISTLVSIYETRDVIMKELQVLLATRLLAVKDYDAVKEIRTVELLKIRFGEAALQVCDVMLKDIADSKRINDHVHGDIKSDVHPLVISRMFWPNIENSALHLPPKLEEAQREYEAAFHRFKPDKHLKILQHLGSVSIRLELADRIVEVEATPLQASIAELFETRDAWSILDLGQKLGIEDEETVTNALIWWAEHGVLKETNKGSWRLLESMEDDVAPSIPSMPEDSGIDRLDETKADAIRVHWPVSHRNRAMLTP